MIHEGAIEVASFGAYPILAEHYILSQAFGARCKDLVVALELDLLHASLGQEGNMVVSQA